MAEDNVSTGRIRARLSEAGLQPAKVGKPRRRLRHHGEMSESVRWHIRPNVLTSEVTWMNLIDIPNGEYRVSARVEDTLMASGVDRGLVVTVYDPQTQVGGLLRFLEPDSRQDPHQSALKPALFADTGLAALVTEACATGAVKNRSLVHIVGTNTSLDPTSKKNYLAARKNLWRIGLCISRESVGGVGSCRVQLEIASGTCSITEGGSSASRSDCVRPPDIS